MKKTQSLKLMLLGLFALVSGSALAQTYKAIEGVVYASYPAEGENPAYATVVGVVNSALPAYNTTGKKITVVDAVDGVNVTAFADGWTTGDWYQNGQYTALPEAVEQAVTDPDTGITTYTNSQASGSTSYTGYKTNDASDITGPVYMLIRASKMTSIKKADVEEFTIEKFTLGEGCGILAIPEYLFAPMKVITSEANQNQINANNSEIESLQTTLANLQGTQTANAEQIDFWTGVIAERENNIAVAKTTTWWKTQEGELQNLQDQKTAYENLRDIIKQLYTVWSDASTTVINAIEAGSKDGLTDAQKTIYDNIVAAMVAANISPKVGGGYNVPNLPDVIQQIETLENTTIPEKEEYMKSQAVFLKEGAQAQSQQNPKFSMNDLENLLQAAKDELAKVDKSDQIKEVSDQIKDLQNQNKELAGDESVLDPDGKNETLLQVNLYDQQLETVGEGAFANCVNAKFGFKNDKFDAAIKTIEGNAFLNTLLEIADLSEATDENLTIDGTAFTGTPLKTLKLQGITSENITPTVVKAIAQSLKKETLSLEFCDWDAAKDVTDINNTLTTVTLPDYEGYTAIDAATFNKCWALTSVSIPASVVTIGKQAFQYTNVPEFDLTNLEGLATIGAAAFSRNPSLTSVKFAEAAPLSELKANTFTGSCALEEVVFNDAMATLPEGLFQTNALTALELCNTSVTVLNNLFLAGPDENEEYVPTYSSYEVRKPNTTVKYVCLPVGLLEVKDFALSSLKALVGTTDDADALAEDATLDKKVVIPYTVETFGDAVFYNDVALEEVEFMDTPLQGLYAHTFAQCSELKKVTFIGINGINPTLFGQPEGAAITWNTYWGPDFGYDEDEEIIGIGDNMFFSCYNKKTEVVVLPDAFTELVGNHIYKEGGIGAYSYLTPYEKVIDLKVTASYNGTEYHWGTYASKYGTWIKAVEGLVVYSAYQDGHNIVLYPAKIKDGYYKIAAYDPEIDWYMPELVQYGPDYTFSYSKKYGNDAAAACIIRYTEDTVKPELYTNSTYKYQTTLDVENILEILDEDVPGSTNTNYYRFGAKGGQLAFNHITDPTRILTEGMVVVNTGVDKGYGSRLNVIVVDENDATAVKGIKEYRQSLSDSDAIYNLNGVRVSTPVKGQIYIQNGKKFIVK